MYRQGHTGIALLVYTPIAYALLSHNEVFLTLLGLLGLSAIEPLPDLDIKLGIAHRGISHSLFAAVVIGGLIGSAGWMLGSRLSVLIDVMNANGLHVIAVTADPALETVRRYGAETLGRVGFAIGAGSIVVHLLGDVITISGIKPFLPFSSWTISVSPLRANNRIANNTLLSIGIIVFIGVVLPVLTDTIFDMIGA